MATFLGLSLDATHDLHLDARGNLAVATDAAAVGQLCKQRLKTYRGEWFLDTNVGVRWFQDVFVRPFNEPVAEAVVKQSILRTLGVTELVGFEMSIRQPRRELRVRAQVGTTFDDIIEVSV